LKATWRAESLPHAIGSTFNVLLNYHELITLVFFGLTLCLACSPVRKTSRLKERDYRDGDAFRTAKSTSGNASATQSRLGESRLLTEHGTLVVAVATNRGLVVCADKRTYDRVRGDLDSKRKIIQVPPSTIVTATGNPTFYDILRDGSLRLAFSAEEVTRQYFLKEGFREDDEFWRNLAYALNSEFERYLNARPFRLWPETVDSDDNALFVIGVFHVDKATGPRALYIRFSYKKSMPPIITIRRFREPLASFSSVKPIMLGNLAVYQEIVSGVDKRFADMRSDKLLAHFLKAQPHVKTVTVNSGLAFARKFIKLTSERTGWIENTDFHVGPTTDCALLSTAGMFKWMGQNIVYRSSRSVRSRYKQPRKARSRSHRKS
jgi:hypothetical protein